MADLPDSMARMVDVFIRDMDVESLKLRISSSDYHDILMEVVERLLDRRAAMELTQ